MANKNLKSTFSNSSKEFIDLKDSLVSNQKWTSLEYGFLNPYYTNHSNHKFYLIFIDDEAYLINDQFGVKTYFISKLEISRVGDNSFYIGFEPRSGSSLDFALNQRETDIIRNYINSLANFESEFLKQLDQKVEDLVKNTEVKSLLTNFLDIYLKDFYKKIDNVYYLEDDLIAPIFCRKKTFGYYIVNNVRNDIETDYQKFLDLLYKKEILNKFEHGKYGFLLLTRCLKFISPNYYAKTFEDSYKGYFKSVEDMSIDECINAYYDIDFLEKTDEGNIGFLTYYLFTKNLFLQKVSNHSILEAFELVKSKVANYENNKELNLFERQLMSNKTTRIKMEFENVSIDDVDMMSGVEFEEFISYLFKRMGHTVNSTPASGDQGIDVVAVKNGLRIGIQTKRYASSVSNKAIQEVVAGIKYYGLEKAIVITNNYFTKSAVELGLSNDVILWDRNILKEKIIEINES